MHVIFKISINIVYFFALFPCINLETSLTKVRKRMRERGGKEGSERKAKGNFTRLLPSQKKLRHPADGGQRESVTGVSPGGQSGFGVVVRSAALRIRLSAAVGVPADTSSTARGTQHGSEMAAGCLAPKSERDHVLEYATGAGARRQTGRARRAVRHTSGALSHAKELRGLCVSELADVARAGRRAEPRRRTRDLAPSERRDRARGDLRRSLREQLSRVELSASLGSSVRVARFTASQSRERVEEHSRLVPTTRV